MTTERHSRVISTEQAAQDFEKAVGVGVPTPLPENFIKKEMILSTGSTLLDLAILGERVYGGGVPGGIIIEIFGEASTGKTALAAEICGHALSSGAEVVFNDPEATLDQEYCEIYGVSLTETGNGRYERMKLVSEVFTDIFNWDPPNKDVVNVYATDSLAALSTELEMEKGDKMGMRRAKEFSEGLRKACVKISDMNKLIICTNQTRQGDMGVVTPGGKGIPFYASVRLHIKPISYAKGLNFPSKLEREIKVGIKSKGITVIQGISQMVEVIKNKKDSPFRTAPIVIRFNYGVDDIYANLQWLKDMTGDSSYSAVDKSYVQLNSAIAYIEENNLEKQLREQVITLWMEIQDKAKISRKTKVRG